MLKKCLWNPWVLFSEHSTLHKYAILILNTQINVCLHSKLLLNIWNNATIRVTVDGGTDEWLSWVNKHKIDHYEKPDLITGDMDSIKKETMNYFLEKGSHVIPTMDQDETDFTKALKELKNYTAMHNVEIDSVLVVCDTCGRLDQIIANINTLFKALHFYPEANVFHLAKASLHWVLDEGQHRIFIPQRVRNSGDWCALMPIGSQCCITTTGLKWNLKNSLLEFGNRVSTSNTYNGDKDVFVETDNKIVWSMGIEHLFES